MTTLIKKRSKKVGLPPGSVVHIGEKKSDAVKIELIDYDEYVVERKEIKTLEELFLYKTKATVTWINTEGLNPAEIINRIGTHFDVHPLAIEDILNTDQRPKIEDHGSNIFIVLKMFTFNEATKEIASEQISIILGNHYVISFQEGIEGDAFNAIRDRITTNKTKIRKLGPDYLAYALIDAIVDNYFTIIEKLGEKIELIESALTEDPKQKLITDIHKIKREMILLRKSVFPLREVISNLQRSDSQLIKDDTKIYIRDVYDHTIQVIDTIETFRDMISSMVEIYLSSISNKLNEVMRILTIVSTIFTPPIFIAGIYGMNFEYMPEIKWHLGYPMALLVMFMSMALMYAYFKKKNWV